MADCAKGRAVPLRWFLPVAAALTAASASASGLWEDGNLLEPPPIAPGETVTIVTDEAADRVA